MWLTVQTVPLFKTDQQSTLRPVGVRNPLIKVCHREVILRNREEIKKVLEPQQLSCSEAGPAKLVMSVRSLVECRRDFITIKLDLKNAFNEISKE